MTSYETDGLTRADGPLDIVLRVLRQPHKNLQKIDTTLRFCL